MSNGYQPPEYQQPQPQQPQYYQPPPEKKGGIGKWIAIGGVGCVLLIAFVAVIVFVVYKMTGGNDSINVVNQHLQALHSGDIDKAYSYTSSPFKEATSLQDFQNFVESYPILKNATEFTSTNREMSNDVLTLKGTIHGADGSKQEAEYRLIKEGSIWKIQYIHLTGAGTTTSQPTEESDQQDQTTQPGADQTETPAAEPPAQETQQPTEGGLEITDVTVNKTAGTDTVNVNLQFKVQQIQISSENQIHVVEDLKTLDPSGNEIADLTIPNFKEANQSVPAGSGPPAVTFTNYLTIPTSFPQGTYTAKLTVHDMVSGQDAESEAQFDIP